MMETTCDLIELKNLGFYYQTASERHFGSDGRLCGREPSARA